MDLQVDPCLFATMRKTARPFYSMFLMGVDSAIIQDRFTGKFDNGDVTAAAHVKGPIL